MAQWALTSNPAHGTYGNRDHFAGLLEMILPLAVGWAISLQTCGHSPFSPAGGSERWQGNTWRTLGAVVLLIAAACMMRALILSVSRMGFLDSLVALTLVGTGLLAILRKLQIWPVPLWLLPVPVVAVLALGMFTSTAELLLRFTEIAELRAPAAQTSAPAKSLAVSDRPAAERVADEFSGDRLDMWRGALVLVHAYPITGVGLGAYQHAFARYQNFLPGFSIDFVHNDYLQILAELGWVGALLAYGLAGVIGFRLISALVCPHPEHWPFALGLAGGLLAIALHSIVDFNLYIPGNALAIAWLAGLAVSPALRSATKRKYYKAGPGSNQEESNQARSRLELDEASGALVPAVRNQRADIF